MTLRTPVIVSAARLPTGKFLGTLKSLQATDLGALAVRAAVLRAGVDPALVEEPSSGTCSPPASGRIPPDKRHCMAA